MTIKTMNSNKQAESAKRPMYQKIAVVAFIVITVGSALTGLMTWKNIGMSDTFMIDWLSSFILTVLTMIPAALLLMTLVNKLVQWAMKQAKQLHQDLMTGLFMALIMESVMAASTAASNVGIVDRELFLSTWGQGFITVIPFGLALAMVMSIYIKPKLIKFMAN